MPSSWISPRPATLSGASPRDGRATFRSVVDADFGKRLIRRHAGSTPGDHTATGPWIVVVGADCPRTGTADHLRECSRPAPTTIRTDVVDRSLARMAASTSSRARRSTRWTTRSVRFRWCDAGTLAQTCGRRPEAEPGPRGPPARADLSDLDRRRDLELAVASPAATIRPTPGCLHRPADPAPRTAPRFGVGPGGKKTTRRRHDPSFRSRSAGRHALRPPSPSADQLARARTRRATRSP